MNILCITEVQAQDRDEIIAIAQGHRVIFSDCPDVVEEEIVRADILFGLPHPDLLKGAVRLKWFQSTGVGVDRYTRGKVLADAVCITNAFNIYADTQSENMLAMLLSVVKKLPQYRDNQAKAIWRDERAIDSISGSRALIIGFGSIGMALGKKLHALGARVTGIRRHNLSVPDFAESVYTVDRLPSLLEQADLILMILPATDQTDGLFDQAMFSHVKRGAYLVNAGRGSTLDTKALCRALDEGILAGAALDVFEQEPLPPDHPLWRYPNVLLTPHVAGRDYAPAVYRQNIALFKENLARYLAHQPLQNVVDRTLGYNLCAER